MKLEEYRLEWEDHLEAEIVLFRCTECGKTSTSIGWLHAHIEKHHGFGPWNLIPDPRKIANFDAHMEKTQVLRVTGLEETSLEELGENEPKLIGEGAGVFEYAWRRRLGRASSRTKRLYHGGEELFTQPPFQHCFAEGISL